MDVDVAGLGGDGFADAAGEEAAQGAVPGGPDDDLGGVDATGEVEDRLADVVAGDGVEGAPQLQHQTTLGHDELGAAVDEPVALRDVTGQQLTAGAPRGDLARAPQQGLALGATGQGDDDTLPRRPRLGDAVRLAVALEGLVDPVREPEEGQLAQRGEVARAEVVRQRGVDLLGLVDVAVGHPTAQRLGRHVDELDLVGGGAHHVVRHGLALLDPGDRLDDVVERLQVLDVDGRDHVDAGGD